VKRIYALLIAVAVLAFGVHLYSQYLLDLKPSEIWTSSAIAAALLTEAVYIAIQATKRYPARAGLLYYTIGLGLATGFCAAYFHAVIVRFLLDLPTSASGQMTSMEVLWIALCCMATTWASGYAALSKKYADLSETCATMTDAATLHKDAELFKLRQQFQPHFLYNSLNSINALIMLDQDRAMQMVGKLSQFLRSSVSREKEGFITVKDELEYVLSYLQIEAIRFGDRLTVSLPEEIGDATLPPFILQPILENAIRFGLHSPEEQVKISLDVNYQEDIIVIKIANPYNETYMAPPGTGYGLKSVARRLQLMYGRLDLLETHREKGIFTTIIHIPQHYETSDHY
jgi:hypothetical protein